jgi:hypothetical protein
MPNILAMQRNAERLIRRWSKDQLGQIVRNGSTRANAYMGFKEFKPSERGLFSDDAKNMAISAVNLPDLDYEQDTIVYLGRTYKILSPPRGARPDGTTVYYEAAVVGIKSSN